MPRVYFMVGIPGSGKSTWAGKNLPGAIIVSTDDIREELFGTADTAHSSQRVFTLAHRRVIEALKSGRDVVFDATNITPKARGKLLTKLQASGVKYEAVAVVLRVTPEKAVEQQQGRDRKVSGHIVRHFHRLLVPPQKEEGFAEVWEVGAAEEPNRS